MRAGSLDRRLTIERSTAGDDGFQTGPVSWAVLATVWAGKSEIGDGERGRAQGLAAEATTRFTIRYSSTVRDISPKDRGVCEGRVYEFTGVKELGRRVGLEITAIRRADV